MTLPTDPAARKAIPIYSGFVKYFPDAMAAVAELSRIGNDQHNPGQPLHWAKGKSTDERDALMRHLLDEAIDPDHRDPDGVHPAVKAAWRAMAQLQRLADAGVDIFAVDPISGLQLSGGEEHLNLLVTDEPAPTPKGPLGGVPKKPDPRKAPEEDVTGTPFWPDHEEIRQANREHDEHLAADNRDRAANINAERRMSGL